MKNFDKAVMSIFSSKFVTIINSFCLVILSQCKLSEEAKTTESDYPQANDGRGFGSKIHWIDVNNAEAAARAMNKPVMLVIHRSWCGACKALKSKFAASHEIEQLSKNFVMVNAGEENKLQGKKYVPDGEYIPRILFFGPDGRLLNEFYNKSAHPSYKFYYSNAAEIVTVMKKVSKYGRDEL